MALLPIVIHGTIPANIYLFKISRRNSRKKCEICSKLTIKTQEPRQRRHRRCSGVFIVNFEHISRLFLGFLLLTLNKEMSARISDVTMKH